MDFTPPARVQPLVAQVRDFVEQELFPLEPAFLNQEFSTLVPQLAEKRAQVKAAGLWAPYLPPGYGGLGLPLVEYAFISEELGRSPLGHYVFNCQAPDVGNLEILILFGNEEQKRTYLEPLARGELRSCFAMTEPE
ncbi:MAG: acyl-CoA dehydrogenase, partial [Chloroflexi bacterium]